MNFPRQNGYGSENQCLLAELIGNTRVKTTLASYLRNERVPSSLIFNGPDPYHQLLFALNFAKALACQNHKMTDACDHCRSCLAIDRGLFPDVQVLEPDGQFYRKTQLDELIASSVQRPFQGEKRVFILKDAQRLNESSANSFLKTLEEPPPSNVFILLTANLNLILPTIQSRCQILKFMPLSDSRGETGAGAPGHGPGQSPPDGFFQLREHGRPQRRRLAGAGSQAPGDLLHIGAPAAPDPGGGHPARPLRPQPRPRDLHRLFPRDGQFDFRAVTGYNGADGRPSERDAHQFGLQGKANGTGRVDPYR